MTLNMAILENVLCVFEDHIYSVVIRCNVLYAYPSKKVYSVFRLLVSLLIFLTACFNYERNVLKSFTTIYQTGFEHFVFFAVYVLKLYYKIEANVELYLLGVWAFLLLRNIL